MKILIVALSLIFMPLILFAEGSLRVVLGDSEMSCAHNYPRCVSWETHSWRKDIYTKDEKIALEKDRDNMNVWWSASKCEHCGVISVTCMGIDMYIWGKNELRIINRFES